MTAVASSTLTPQERVVRLLRERNQHGAAAVSATRRCTELLSEIALLEAAQQQQHHASDLMAKERHMMEADLQLLRQNEQNAGVSREHIELLQEQLEKSKSEAASFSSAAAAARASEAETADAAKLMATKLAEAQARAADLEHELKQVQAENERLMERLTVKLEAQAIALDSERERSSEP